MSDDETTVDPFVTKSEDPMFVYQFVFGRLRFKPDVHPPNSAEYRQNL